MLIAAPPLPNQERGVRARIAHILATLYPHEPNRSRAEFQRLVSEAKAALAAAPKVEAPAPPKVREGELFPGTRYRVTSKLGEGASASVLAATHVDLQRQVAMKVLSDRLHKDTRAEERFRREARVMARLSHPGIVSFYDYGETAQGAHFIVMERIEGESLERWMERKGTVSKSDAVGIAKQLLSALEIVHRAGVVHRDIKPSNILITPEGRVKLVDFGVASVEGETDVEPEHAVYGTHEYMAPEQATGSSVDGRADLYAVGCILYELLTGTTPHTATARVPLLEAKRTVKAVAPSERASEKNISRSLDELVLQALSVTPEERPADARAMGEALEASLEEATPAPPPPRRRTARAVVAAIMAGALAVAGFAAWGSPDEVTRTAGPVAAKVAIGVASWVSSVKDRGSHPATYDVRRAGRVLAELSLVEFADASSQPVAEAPRTAPEESAPSEAPTPVAQPAQTLSREELTALKNKAKRALARHRWEDARRYAESWIKADASREGRLVLARALIYSGKQSEGRDVLRSLLEIDPTCDDARQLLQTLDTTTQPTAQARASRPKNVRH
ncbi:MAG: serine/threonine-protein kinase [Polyangiaceae bacterium]